MLCLGPAPGLQAAGARRGAAAHRRGSGEALHVRSCLWQNKEYVCRGHDYERLEAFQQRMLSEFPQAVAMQHPNRPDDAILQCDAQCIF